MANCQMTDLGLPGRQNSCKTMRYIVLLKFFRSHSRVFLRFAASGGGVSWGQQPIIVELQHFVTIYISALEILLLTGIVKYAVHCRNCGRVWSWVPAFNAVQSPIPRRHSQLHRSRGSLSVAAMNRRTLTVIRSDLTHTHCCCYLSAMAIDSSVTELIS